MMTRPEWISRLAQATREGKTVKITGAEPPEAPSETQTGIVSAALIAETNPLNVPCPACVISHSFVRHEASNTV